jgi:peptidoglycan/xylan/chitin deacetylase (PgdA/CDA1 family)
MRKSRKKMWAVLCAAMLTMACAGNVWADEAAQGGHWINVEKGPGVAQWVDDNGVVTEQPGDEPDQGQDSQDPGETSQSGEDGQAAAEAGENQEGQVSQEGEGSAQTAESGQGEDPASADQAAGQPEGSQGEQVPEAAQEGQGQEAAGQQQTGRVIDPGRPMVALTFDDGPFAPVGNQIMDCLAQYGGKATFYVVGNRCASYAAEMQRMAAEGHEIGNHTYEHKYLHKLSAEQIQYQVNKGSEAIQASCGVIPATVRLPGGNKNATVLANVHQPIIMWSIDTLDWKTKNTQSTVDKVLGSVRDGDIVLMHELYAQTGNAAVQIIPALVERGFQLVTVSELAQYRGGLAGGRIYSAFRP